MKILSIFSAFSAVALGVYLSLGSWHGMIAFERIQSNSEERIPAAIKGNLDFSKLNGSALISASKKRLITAAEIGVEPDNNYSISFGHFLSRNESGQKQLACDLFDQVEIKLEAEGIAVSGEKPILTVLGHCESTQDFSQIKPIQIPFQKLANMNANSLKGGVTLNENKYSAQNLPNEWPSEWIVTEVKLLNSKNKVQDVAVAPKEVTTQKLKFNLQQFGNRLPSNF